MLQAAFLYILMKRKNYAGSELKSQRESFMKDFLDSTKLERVFHITHFFVTTLFVMQIYNYFSAPLSSLNQLLFIGEKL